MRVTLFSSSFCSTDGLYVAFTICLKLLPGESLEIRESDDVKEVSSGVSSSSTSSLINKINFKTKLKQFILNLKTNHALAYSSLIQRSKRHAVGH